MNKNKFLSRKWGMGLLIIALASAALFVGLMPASVWASVVVGIYVGYSVVNVAEKRLVNDKQE